MKVGLLTREYPPDVYGGAGVHVDFLSRELRPLVDLAVHAWGADRISDLAPAQGHSPATATKDANPALATLSVDLSMAAAVADRELVHSHTWYANLAGHIAKLLYDIPHVVTTHSLEPLRPWKVEQLGGGYALSCWAEKTAIDNADAIIAVSHAMRSDIVRLYPEVNPDRVTVIPNGIDSDLYQPTDDRSAWAKHGLDPDRPTVLFVGRVTRQKGVQHLVRAAAGFRPEAQLVLCAGEPDTPELKAEFTSLVTELQANRDGVHWIPQMLPQQEVIQLLSGSTVFACPSVYEPQGIVNLEAMACETAVVASEVGGIPDVVINGSTGLLVPYNSNEPRVFEAGFTEEVNKLLDDPERAAGMGRAGRRRAIEEYGWDAIAARTVAIYERAGERR
ncbi:glycogen synthase [Antrihabitans sp. YC2-6]|uniref:glycogen synthase n=1 Tax=Antrihabitans sp. YC2-6 TaxID=2799498 RepID=UPI0018F79D82|nr:glycogen synthase [Antrihabitans sp. YC2-6]MBJ8345136.1 glycogen synthase [Antrihabitans sp. YC2-6]